MQKHKQDLSEPNQVVLADRATSWEREEKAVFTVAAMEKDFRMLVARAESTRSSRTKKQA